MRFQLRVTLFTDVTSLFTSSPSTVKNLFTDVRRNFTKVCFNMNISENILDLFPCLKIIKNLIESVIKRNFFYRLKLSGFINL